MTRRRQTRPKRRRPRPLPELQYVAEVLAGVAPAAERELLHAGVRITGRSDTELQFETPASTARLANLLYPVAIYRVVNFTVPRPKALLGDEHFRQLLSEIQQVQELQPTGFSSFRIGAAGSDSPVFQRLASDLQKATDLQHDPEKGELLLRFRPFPAGWQVLLRTTPRPLSSREWRVCNLPGGLNATIAVLMLEQLGMRGTDRYLNAMCGSGTLLAERVLAGPAQLLVGLDQDAAALDCARANLLATGKADSVQLASETEAVELVHSGRAPGVVLLQADATATAFPVGSFSVMTSDLPWGDAVGTHSENAALYPAFLAEARRLLVTGGKLVLLSHEVRLLQQLLPELGEWRVLQETMVAHGGHHPRIFLLEAI